MPTLLDTLADPARLAVLAATGMAEVPASAGLDRLTELAAMTLDVPIAFVTLVDDEHQVFASAVGLPAPVAADRRLPLSHSFCRHVIHAGEPLIVDDARRAALVRDNPAVTDLGVRAYAGMPLVVAGQVLGAFGGIDTVPRAWTVHELGVLGRLAGAAGDVLALRAGSADALVGEAPDLSVLHRLPGLRVSRPDPRRAGPRRPAPGPS